MYQSRSIRTLIVVISLLGIWDGLPGHASARDKVSLRLDWIPGAEHAFVYLAKEKGWFGQNGIDVDILPGHGSTVSVKLVGNRDNDFAFSDGATLVQAWERNVPLMSLAVLYHDTPTVVASKAKSGIKSLNDLCGKKVGVMIKSTTYAQFKGMMSAAKISCSYEEVPASPGGRELLSGKVVAQAHYGFLIAPIMKMKGVEPSLIRARDYFHLYSQTIIANDELVKKNPDLVRRFMTALMHGLRYSLDHPNEALASFLKANPEANKEYERRKLTIVNGMFRNPGPWSEKLGIQSPEGWAQSARTLYKIHVTNTLVDTKGRFTNKFIE